MPGRPWLELTRREAAVDTDRNAFILTALDRKPNRNETAASLIKWWRRSLRPRPPDYVEGRVPRGDGCPVT